MQAERSSAKSDQCSKRTGHGVSQMQVRGCDRTIPSGGRIGMRSVRHELVQKRSLFHGMFMNF